MSQFIGTEMSRGFAGEITRGYFDNTVEIKKNDAAAPVQAFGVAVKLNTTKDGVTPATANADAASLWGFSVRQYGQVDCQGNQTQNLVAVLRRGYVAVKLAEGTAALGAPVYLSAKGEVTATKGENTAIPGAVFMGPADADGLVEIAFNI